MFELIRLNLNGNKWYLVISILFFFVRNFGHELKIKQICTFNCTYSGEPEEQESYWGGRLYKIFFFFFIIYFGKIERAICWPILVLGQVGLAGEI